MNFLSLIPAILGYSQQQKANSLNRDALALQQNQYRDYTKPTQDRFLMAANMIMDAVASSKKAGAYDPDKIKQNMRNEYDRAQGRSMSNLAVNLRRAGYKNGDAEAVRSMTDLGDRYGRDIAAQSTQIDQQAPLALAQALAAASAPAAQGVQIGNIGASTLAGAMNNQAAMMSPGDPGGFLASIMPFLQSTSQAAPAPSGTVAGHAGNLIDRAVQLNPQNNNTAAGGILSGLVTKAA